MSDVQVQAITKAEAEAFLVEEAALLDEWRLTEWLTLMCDDGRYLVPALDRPGADPTRTLFMIDDDMATLRSRAQQLLGRSVWAETPRSRTRRLLTNFRVIEAQGDSATVLANFAVWRFQLGNTDIYVGQYRHKLVRTADGLRFKERRATLDLEALRPHGKLSFIL